ncbi:1,4-dihydroxy-6-naphthoate synthase [Sphingobacterium corticibacter]|uniref:1,4-dihydroxy-6-naphtoate synthase n=1 Tax=Sphingobacterium corticibacter TaxID=2171749 RepID=A0A2T8HJS2_9SPHI|nr:1,4-dihydroxy-6-naphthoate synthase [Sphingobacterium corticibacter]PVH25694.1 1,4-dihydroxy-6-naphthoate synthase [Sphingobacterium corticibacter]
MKLSLGFSPCPNDTFIFDALIHGKIDTGDLSFEPSYQDVETLNQMAFAQQLDITKLSYHAFAYAAEDYELLDAGSALGFGVGPLLITKDKDLAERLSNYAGQDLPADLLGLRVGIPGKYTTANFLLGLAYPQLTNKQELVFSDIENAVLDGRVDVGLIIHENRFTYSERGLSKAQDLGEFWERDTGYPIPLGGIVIKRSLPQSVKQQVNKLIADSVRFAFANPKSGLDYIRSHAQEMEESVMYQHIDLYVNKYSENLGEKGRASVNYLFSEAERLELIPPRTQDLFLASI